MKEVMLDKTNQFTLIKIIYKIYVLFNFQKKKNVKTTIDPRPNNRLYRSEREIIILY